MDKNYEQLNQRIAELEKQFANLKQASTIPLDIEKALAARGFVVTAPIGTPPGDWDLNEGFIVTIDGTQAQGVATKYLAVKYQGQTQYYIPLNSFSEL